MQGVAECLLAVSHVVCLDDAEASSPQTAADITNGAVSPSVALFPVAMSMNEGSKIKDSITDESV